MIRRKSSLTLLAPWPGFKPAEPAPCSDIRHEVPLVAFAVGTWSWTCPACGAVKVFDVIQGECVLPVREPA